MCCCGDHHKDKLAIFSLYNVEMHITVVSVLCSSVTVLPYSMSVCLSVCLWRLWIVTIEVDAYQKIITLGTSLAATACPAIKVYGKFPNFRIKQSGVCKRQFFHRKSKIYLKRCSIQQKIQQSVDINLYSPYRLVTYRSQWHCMTSEQVQGHFKSPIWVSVIRFTYYFALCLR